MQENMRCRLRKVYDYQQGGKVVRISRNYCYSKIPHPPTKKKLSSDDMWDGDAGINRGGGTD